MFSNYKFRCSSLGNLITKDDKLTELLKTYLDEIFTETIYKVRKEVYSKYFEKGIKMEDESVKMLNVIYKDFLLKNEERIENDYISGECDVLTEDEVIDIKNAYDKSTFGKCKLTKDYEWQLYGYCWLFNRVKGRLFYTLNNLPYELLESEKRQLLYKNPTKYLTSQSENYLKDCELLEQEHNYDNMPIYERFKVFDVEFKQEHKERITKMGAICRNYLNKKYQEYLKQIEFNKSLIK